MTEDKLLTKHSVPLLDYMQALTDSTVFVDVYQQISARIPHHVLPLRIPLSLGGY